MILGFVGNLGFLDLIIIVAAVLNLILFFKIWGMTNNVKHILEEQKESRTEIVEQMRKLVSFFARKEADDMKYDFEVGDMVTVISTGERLLITDIDIDNKKYFCFNEKENKGRYYRGKEIRK